MNINSVGFGNNVHFGKFRREVAEEIIDRRGDGDISRTTVLYQANNKYVDIGKDAFGYYELHPAEGKKDACKYLPLGGTYERLEDACAEANKLNDSAYAREMQDMGVFEMPRAKFLNKFTVDA